jgi:hypothetical protein
VCRSKVILLLALFVLCLAPLCAQESLIDSALAELTNLEDSLIRQQALIETLQTDLYKEKLWSISLQRQSEADRISLTQQAESLSQAEAVLQRLERSLNLSKLVNLVAVPVALVSTTILVLILVK